ncbi:cytochrome P450 [Saccharibacillus alkalitolerans]|uniref:Cytochrome P450 n=1 Tax=Saccharibacillus alkalitolerans TaxID=2705290 RepID=A0ABX0F294_9BACL|nr:cytochrome P450 [Saccharibacillus alkalitolerans]NGZ75113.1 cytochrome P450 [Saccharibacillus alkalitolerans]
MTQQGQTPQEHTPDNSLALLKDGYDFIFKRRREMETEIFRTRLLGQPAICIGGKDAAELFYDTSKFQRSGAIPKRIQKSLFGENAIQTMDGDAHRHRKMLFMSLMSRERLDVFMQLLAQEWEAAIGRWEGAGEVELFGESQELLHRAACRWAGVPIEEETVRNRADDMGAMVEAFGAVGPRHAAGRRARRRTEEWLEGFILDLRAGEFKADEGTAAYAMAFHRDLQDRELDSRMAAIELINIVRPIVAIGRYVVFTAIALHEHPEYREKLAADEGKYRQWFVQETRRYYPFTPFLGASVIHDFTWKGHEFEEGTMVLLDVYGTTHDPALWDEADKFKPERFENWGGSPFDLIPQGGGDPNSGHRCAGEWLTIDAMRVSLEFLTNRMAYDVPEQDLELSLSRMPALPESRFVITNVRLASSEAAPNRG